MDLPQRTWLRNSIGRFAPVLMPHSGAPEQRRVDPMTKLTLLLLTSIVIGCHVHELKSQTTPNIPDSAAAVRPDPWTHVWREKGVTITLPDGWFRMDDDDKEERMFSKFADLKEEYPWNHTLSITVSVNTYKPEWGNKSIDEETDHYYSTHGGPNPDEELSFVTIDGIRGVYYVHRQEEPAAIIWRAQRMAGQERQVLGISIMAPRDQFATNRENFNTMFRAVRFSEPITGDSQRDSSNAASIPDFVGVTIISDDQIYVGKHLTERAEISRQVDHVL